MVNDRLKILEELLLGNNGLLISLRMGDGLNKEKFKQVCYTLKKLADHWTDKDEIPKFGAHLLFEMYLGMSSGNIFYSDDELEEIEIASDKVYNLILECLGDNKTLNNM